MNRIHDKEVVDLLMDLIPRTMQVLREEMRQERGDLSIPQFRVLAAINRGICGNKKIGDHLGVSEAAASRMIDILVSEKLVIKKENLKDRRCTKLEFSELGKKRFNQIKDSAKTNILERMKLLSDEEKVAFYNGLKILNKFDFIKE